jgi:hypothetical protein
VLTYISAFLKGFTPAVANRNEQVHGKMDIPVHGLLTDLTRFIFFSFDPTAPKFLYNEELSVGNNREGYLGRMVGGEYRCLCAQVLSDNGIIIM